MNSGFSMINWFGVSLTVGLLFLLPGLLMLWFGWRGQRIDDHNTCRACGFDLFGSGESPDECPECGADLKEPHSIRVGNRKRHMGRVVVGILFILIGLGPFGLWGASSITQTNWQQYKPLWMLRQEAHRHGTPASAAALTEILLRLQNQQLTGPQMQPIVQEVLTVQANPQTPWDTKWGEIFEVANGNGWVPAADLERYIQTAMDHSYTFHVRPEVTHGDPFAYQISKNTSRIGENAQPYVQRHDATFRINGVVLETAHGYSGESLNATGTGTSTSSVTPSAEAWAQISPGEHKITLTYRAEVYDDWNRTTLLLRKEYTHEDTFTILPKDQPTEQAVNDLKHLQAVEGAVQVNQIRVSKQGNLSSEFEIKPRPVSIAFRVEIEDENGNRYDGGTFSVSASRSMHYHVGSGKKYEIPGENVDIILIPDEETAKKSVDITDYWGEEIRFNDVPLKREQ